MATKGGKHGKSRKAATKKANGYYSRQAIQTERNRRRKQLKHFRNNPNQIKGFEKLRESLGLA